MSWSQVYITGLARSLEPSDEEIETLLRDRFGLASEDDTILWAGPGTTLVKRDEKGLCRGFAFLAFYSEEGALIVVDRINSFHDDEGSEFENSEEHHNGQQKDTTTSSNSSSSGLPRRLRADLSKPKAGKEKSKKKVEEQYLPDARLRRHRAPPVRKHPVIISSTGKRTNLGNKTK